VNLDIGAKLPVNGDQVLLVGRCFSSAEAPFVLLYDTVKARRARQVDMPTACRLSQTLDLTADYSSLTL
jgi:hypothetical protein